MLSSYQSCLFFELPKTSPPPFENGVIFPNGISKMKTNIFVNKLIFKNVESAMLKLHFCLILWKNADFRPTIHNVKW